MKISTSASSPTVVAADLLAVAVTLPVKLEGAAAALDEALGGQLTELAAAGEIRGNRGRVVVVHTAGRGVKAKRVAVVGLERRPRWTRRRSETPPRRPAGRCRRPAARAWRW